MSTQAISIPAHSAPREHPSSRPPRHRGALVVLTILYGVTVAGLTLGPQSFVYALHSLMERVAGRAAASVYVDFGTPDFEFTANVVMFIPLGILAALWLRRAPWLAILVTGFILSSSIEFAQIFLPGRVTDVRDVIANTLGTAIGSLLVLALRGAVGALKADGVRRS